MEQKFVPRVIFVFFFCFSFSLITFDKAYADRPIVQFDEKAPLQRAIEEKVKKRREKERKDVKIHPQCARALSILDDPDLTEAEKEAAEEDVAKFCGKSPGLKKSLRKSTDITINGKKRGKKIKNTTTIKFGNAGQRYGHEMRDKWDRVVIKPPKTGDLTPRVYRDQSNTRDRTRKKMLFTDESEAINNDHDCSDTVTGEHLRDGSCFDENGALLKTLTAVEGGCVHANGTFFEGAFPPVDEDGDGDIDENSCYDSGGNLKTSLVELFDEDGMSYDNDGDGVVFDIDGDGFDGEDPPNPGEFPVNDDRDCVDMVTGNHKGGIGIPDGDPLSCFDVDGTVKETLQPVEGGCEHIESGTFFEGDLDTMNGCLNAEGAFLPGDPYDGIDDDCYDASGAARPGVVPRYTDDACYDAGNNLKTTLAELVDEDNGQPIDDDGDGLTDEDGPEASRDFIAACRNFGARAGLVDTTDMYDPEGGCDLTRAVIVMANKKSKEVTGKKVYQADDEGYTDPSVEDEIQHGGNKWKAKEYGTEERQVVIEEDFVVMCDEGMVFDDDTGQCIAEAQVAALNSFRDSLEGDPAVALQSTSVDQYAMMGFTFAPPHVRWGLFYREELDLWFFTITLYDIKIGYDFGIGAGFRLPVEVTVMNLPDVSILAEGDLNLETELQPVNFSAEDYRSFCAVNQMGDAAFCNRFAFPNALDPEDGDELAIRLTAFAGVKVVILEIPLVNWGLDVDADLPEWCSLYLAMNEEPDALAQEVARQLAMGVAYPFGKALTEMGINCGTYVTPFGMERDDVPRQFPFIQNAPFVNQMIRADCAEAFVRGETIKLPSGEIFPICTGLILGVPGASLGLGLGVDLEVSSQRIDADVTVSGDATFNPQDPFGTGSRSRAISYTQSADEGGPPVALDPIRTDNYDGMDFKDQALVSIGDFTYCLNTFSIRLKGQAMFGGILTIFPDFDDFTIYRFTIPGTGCGIPIGQHSGTSGVTFGVPVENYGLEVQVEPATNDPALRVGDKTLMVKPGEFGEFIVSVRNTGSFTGDFDNFSYALSNLKDQTQPFTFEINQNTDLDCRNSLGTILRGDECFDVNGQLLPGLIELINEDDFGPAGALQEVRDADGDGLADEDPPDEWATVPTLSEFGGQAIFQVEPYAYSSPPPAAPAESLVLAIRPFRHPLTRPGIYPFKVTADSWDAKSYGLAPIDPSGHYRMGANDVAFIQVVSFRDPQIAVDPMTTALKPGVPQTFNVEGSNMGNVVDSLSVGVNFIDFNPAGCTLTTLGTESGCPFRAVPTVIQSSDWTTVSGLFTQINNLEPIGAVPDSFDILVPRDWAGMTDTTYQYEITVVSLDDDQQPPASNTVLVEQTVIATKESMTRYIGLEIRELISEIENANVQGINTGGLLPIASHPALQMIDEALDLILSGDMNKASNTLSSNIRIMEAFVRALDGFNGKGNKIPADMDLDWHARARAIIEDLQLAAASDIASAP